MVVMSIHYIFGVLIAYLLGYRGNKKFWLGLIAIIPDLDAIFFFVLMLGKGLFGYSFAFYEQSQLAVMLLGHRGISHSLLLLGVAVLVTLVFTRKKQILIAVFSIWGSHLVLDSITSWKFFPFLPWSYTPFYLGIVEVFDSWLVLLTSLILAFLICSSLIKIDSRKGPIFAYVFLLAFGVYPSVRMGEFNIQTILLSQFVILAAAFYCVFSLKNRRKGRLDRFVSRGILWSSLVTVGYLVLLVAGKVLFVVTYSLPFIALEPLEEMAYNGNTHTYELDEGDAYRIGMVSLQEKLHEQVIPKVVNDIGVDGNLVMRYQEAYRFAIHTNWINYPVWTFHRDEAGVVYANIRYAKSFLPTEFSPGPQRGINKMLQDGLLVRYGRTRFH